MDQPVLVWGVFEETLFCLRRGVCSSYRLHCKIFMVCSSWWLSAAAASCNKQHLLFLLLNLPSWAGHLTDPIFCPNVALKLGKGAERGLLPGRPTEDWVAAEPIPAPALLASQNHPDIPKLETRKRRNRNHGDAVWNIKFVSWFVNPFVFSAKLLFPRSCQMTSGHKRKEVASVSVLPEAEPPNGRNIQARGHPSSPPLPPLVP